MAGRALNRIEADAESVELAPAQCLAVAALAGGSTITSAAEAAGVSRPTVYAWLDGSPEFVAELNRARAEQRDALRADLRSLATAAVDAMRQLIESPETPAPVRLRACLAVLAVAGADAPPLPIGSTRTEDIANEIQERDLFRAVGMMH